MGRRGLCDGYGDLFQQFQGATFPRPRSVGVGVGQHPPTEGRRLTLQPGRECPLESLQGLLP
jgi:hypothetical protein